VRGRGQRVERGEDRVLNGPTGNHALSLASTLPGGSGKNTPPRNTSRKNGTLTTAAAASALGTRVDTATPSALKQAAPTSKATANCAQR
jgi:hypothetical protein